MLDEHGSFPRTGTELPSEAQGKDPRGSPRGDICRPGVLGELTAAAVPEPACAPLPPTSDNVSYVRFRPYSFRACFPQRNRPAPLHAMRETGLRAAGRITVPEAVIERRPDSAAVTATGERTAAVQMAGEPASVLQTASAQIAAAM